MFDIGYKITKLRKRQGMTQGRLASLLDMTRENLNRIEKSKVMPTIQTLLKICEISNITISDFFSEDDTKSILDLREWLLVGEQLTPPQRKSIIQTINQLKGDDPNEQRQT